MGGAGHSGGSNTGHSAWKLDEKSFHILHFIGHGTFDLERGGGVILLEGEEGGPDPMGAQELSVLLGAHPELRLAVLNICHGAKGNGAEPFSPDWRRA